MKKLQPKNPEGRMGGRNNREERRLLGEYLAAHGIDPKAERRNTLNPRRRKQAMKKFDNQVPVHCRESRELDAMLGYTDLPAHHWSSNQ